MPPAPTLFHLTPSIFRIFTPLHLSAKNGHFDICRLLLLCGASANAYGLFTRQHQYQALNYLMNANSYTPLHFAAYYGHLEVCRLLLNANANMETNTCADQTPLSLAAQKGNTEVCRLLLEKGADTEAIDSSTWTPLHHAVNGGFLDICRLLVESKAHIDVMRRYLGTRALSFFLRAYTMRYSDGKTPLQMARKLKHTEIVEYLKNKKEGGHVRKRRRM